MLHKETYIRTLIPIQAEEQTSLQTSEVFFKFASLFRLKSYLNIHTKVFKVHLQTLLENLVCLYGSPAEHYHLHNSEPTKN